jgi:hypothetical protein
MTATAKNRRGYHKQWHHVGRFDDACALPCINLQLATFNLVATFR